MIAKNNKKTSADFLEQLIYNSTDHFASLKKEINTVKSKLKIEQADAKKEIDQYKQVSELATQLLGARITDCCKMEILLRDAGIAIDSVTDDQKMEAEEMTKANIAIANAAIDKKHRSLSGLHNIKRPMDRPDSEATYTRKKTASKAKTNRTTIVVVY